MSGSAPATPAGGHTTFSLMPEDNPFQNITIGSLLGWGSYGRVHRGGCAMLWKVRHGAYLPESAPVNTAHCAGAGWC